MDDEDFEAIADMPTEPIGDFDFNNPGAPGPGGDVKKAASGIKEGAAKVGAVARTLV